jgi:hypothetical protein
MTWVRFFVPKSVKIMNTTNATNTSGGFIDPAKYRQLMRQYERENPHNLPDMPRRRNRFARRVGVPEKVYTTRRLAIA